MSDTPIVPPERMMMRSILSSSDRSGPDAKGSWQAGQDQEEQPQRPRISSDRATADTDYTLLLIKNAPPTADWR
jgi:hypothetical protein